MNGDPIDEMRQQAGKRYAERHGTPPPDGFLSEFSFYANRGGMQPGQMNPRRLFYLGSPRITEHPAIQDGTVPKGGLFVDAGCGPGDDSRWLHENGYGTVIGIDADAEAYRLGRAFYRDEGSTEPVFLRADLRSMPLHSGSAAAVYNTVIHAFQPPEAVSAFLEESRRVLVPGGPFFGSTLGAEERVGGFTSLQLTQQELRRLIGGAFRLVDFQARFVDPGGPKYRAYFFAVKE